MKSHKNRCLSLALALLLSVSLFSVFMMPATEIQASKNSQFEDFTHVDAEPEGFDPQDPNNPYGYDVGQPFLLMEQNELLLYQTYDLDKGGRAWTTYYEGFDKGRVTKNVASGNLDVAVNSWRDQGSFAGFGTFADTRAYGYVQAVAFDATGSGRRDHVAYVGYDYQTKKVVTWVQDAREHNRKTAVKVLGTAEWISNTQGENGLGQYKAKNFFSITAGDYDGDGRETYVVYVPGDGDGYGLSEIRLTSYFGLDYKDSKYIGFRDCLHHFYLQNGASLAHDNMMMHKLCAALATGDFNGDGIDDLVVLSYINRPESSKQSFDSRLYAPFLATVSGAKGCGTILKKSYDSAYIRKVEKVVSDKTYYHSMIAPGIAAGDIDGDGFDDLVVTGVKNTNRTKVNSEDADDPYYSTDNSKFSVAIFRHASTLADFSLEDIATTKWHQSGFYPRQDDVWQQTAVETVAIDGKGAAEYIFIQGGLYQVSPVDGKITAKLIPDYFTKKDSAAGGSVIGVAYIQSVAAGNFDDNEAGREQVVFVIGLRQTTMWTSSDYYFRLGMIGGDEYEDTADSYGSVKNFYANDIDKGQYFVAKKGDKLKQTLNAEVVTIDRDQDGLMGRYKGTEYSYSDPSVLAALQAAPWFGELGSWGDYQGRTSYGFSQTYSFSTVTSETKSFGLGIAIDAQAAIGPKISFQEGCTGEWNKSFKKSLEESYSSTFTAGAFDTVVLYRTPIVMYLYDLMVDGKWKENAVGLAFPQQPNYVQWSLDDYNAFVDYYNAYAADLNRANPDKLQIQLLHKLEDGYLGNEGNPWGYRSSWTGTDAVNLSKTYYSLGHAGGQTTSGYSYQGSETTGFENSNGTQMSLTMQVGAAGPGGGAWVGVAMQFAASQSYGQYTTVAKGTETSGTVFDINKYRLSSEGGIPQATSESYKFNWTFGKWSFNPGGASNEKTPIMGYALTGIKAPVPQPGNLTASLNPDDAAGSIILTWEKPNEKNRLKADGYNIYQKKGKAAFELVNPVPLSSDTLTYTLKGLESNSDYAYMVKASSHGSPESIPSNKASIRTAGSDNTITFDFNENDVTVNARHTGNLPIQSGDQIPIDSIVYLKLTPKKDRTITRVELEVNGKRRDITNVTHEYNFIMQGGTRVIVTSKIMTILEEVEIEYNERYEGPDAAEIGRVSATAGGYPFSSGATVSGPVEFTASPSEGYVLEKWIVTTGTEVSDHMANGKNIWLFKPYAGSHKIEARFVQKDDPLVNRRLTITDMEGGGLLVNGVRSKDQTLTLPVGTPITFKPDPDVHHAFRMWTEDLSSYGSSVAPISLVLLDDMIVGARFYAPVKYAVTFAAVQAGDLTATSNGALLESGALLLPGSSLVFEAKAHPGNRLEKWRITKGTEITEISVEGLVTQAAYEIGNLQKKHFVQAFFKEIEEYRLTIHQEGDGAVRILREGRELADGDPIYFYDLLTISAVPGLESSLGSLQVNGEIFMSDASLRVEGDILVDAAFMAGNSHELEQTPITTERSFETETERVDDRQDDAPRSLGWVRITLIILASVLVGSGILLAALLLKKKKDQG